MRFLYAREEPATGCRVVVGVLSIANAFCLWQYIHSFGSLVLIPILSSHTVLRNRTYPTLIMALVRSLYSLLAISFYIGNTFAERQCYALNGTQLGDEYGACNPNAKHSGCCAINGTAGTAELCLSNGLCMATNNEYMGTIWQNGCTDPTGADPSCPKICSDGNTPRSSCVQQVPGS